jgi:nucleoside-diphosphate-sugar epimerase
MSRHCLVTGGAGFIGSNLVKRLVADDWDVFVVDDLSSGQLDLLDGLNWKKWGDPEDIDLSSSPEEDPDVLVCVDSFFAASQLKLVEDGFYDIVFHQAAVPRVSYSVEDPIGTMETNLLGTAALFKAAADGDTPIVWASSSSVYGGALSRPTIEGNRGEVLPKSPYAMQKYHCEDYAALFGELYGLRSVGLRYFNVFGPGQYGDSAYATAVSAWCHAIKEGEECRSDGDGEQTRDMCYVDNVVQANVRAAQMLLDGCVWATRAVCYNVACGDRVSNNEILQFLKNRFDDRVKIRHASERAGDVKHTLADIDMARDDFGYEVEVRFWEGLEKTLAWWELT